MDEIREIFSSREQALLFWGLLIIIVFQFYKPIRQSIFSVVKAFFYVKLISIVFLALTYSSSIIYLLWKIDFWKLELLKDSIFWFFGSGFIILMNLTKAHKEKNFFKNIVKDNLKLILILELVINFHQFSLITEIILFPIIVFLVLMQKVAERKEESKQVKSIIDWILVGFGICVLVLSSLDIWNNYKEFANISNLESFLLPIILSITFVPFAYALTLFMNYEMLFIRLSLFLKKKEDLAYAKWRSIRKANFSLKKLNLISKKINALHNRSERPDIEKIIS